MSMAADELDGIFSEYASADTLEKANLVSQKLGPILQNAMNATGAEYSPEKAERILMTWKQKLGSEPYDVTGSWGLTFADGVIQGLFLKLLGKTEALTPNEKLVVEIFTARDPHSVYTFALNANCQEISRHIVEIDGGRYKERYQDQHGFTSWHNVGN